jgi:hypothetical protein
VTTWKALRPDDVTGITWMNPPFISPNSDAYAYTYNRALMNLYLIEGLR